MAKTVGLRLFGAFQAFDGRGRPIKLGIKHQAVLAMLATAPDGTRTRAFLEAHIWSLVPSDQAKASLRAALTALRKAITPDSGEIINADRERVRLDLEQVEFVGGPKSGVLMEGFDLSQEEAFEDWLRSERANRTNVGASFGAAMGAAGDARLQSLEPLLPGIAILPFQHRGMSGAKNPLGSILAEELSREISRSNGFAVTSYLTSRRFNPETVRPLEVAQTCEVEYIVTGSLIVSGQEFRLVADLQNARRERLIWSREFVGSLSELLNGQLHALSDLAGQICRTAIGEALRSVRSTPMHQLDCHTLLMAGISLLQEPLNSEFSRAGQVFQLLVEREPRHAIPRTWLGFWHVLRVQRGLTPDRFEDTDAADRLADQALTIDPSFSLAQTLKAMVASHLLGRFDIARAAYNTAIQDNPNEALALLLKGAMRAFQGKADEAVRLTEQARRLSPLDPQSYYFDALAATAYLAAGQYDRSISLADRSLATNHTYPSTLRTKAIALEMAGRGDEARVVVRNLMQLTPDLTVSGYRASHTAARYAVGQEWARALGAAGVPN
ncbi:MAG: transcriptional regulator [Pseudomonadota bacterium]